MLSVDVAIVGGGIAGAGLAAMLGGGVRVAILEMEDVPGYHTTGRSAAFFAETYGGPGVQPLSTASRDFLLKPPAGFTDVPLLTPRGCLHLATEDELPLLADMDRLFAASSVALEPLDRAAMRARLPGLGDQWVAGRFEPRCGDMDVAAIHQGFLRMARRDGARLMCNARLVSARHANGRWRLETRADTVEADVVVIAAGAWADEVAGLLGARPLGIMPLRRTVVQVETEPALGPDIPIVMDIGGQFYFRPDAGGIWISPHDETPDVPSDVQPEELDIAIAIDRFENAGAWRVIRKSRAWAGLRNFAPDRLPVYGFDPVVPGVFWCAGQGGFGIQTAPAASMLAAALLTGHAMPDAVAHIDAAHYAPARFNPDGVNA